MGSARGSPASSRDWCRKAAATDRMAPPRTVAGDPQEVVEGLSRIGLIAALPPEEVASLVPHVQRLTVRAGTRLFKGG